MDTVERELTRIEKKFLDIRRRMTTDPQSPRDKVLTARVLLAYVLAFERDEQFFGFDPILEIAEGMTDMNFRLVSIEPPHEFPPGCALARIAGPSIENGLPFCIPAEHGDVWARRIVLVLSRVYLRGLAQGAGGRPS
jgi:hypothetical protein